MSGAILFEQPYRGDVWRLEIASHDGRMFGNWRKWYWDGDTLKPTRHGCSIPLERFTELHAKVGGFLAEKAPDGPPSVK